MNAPASIFLHEHCKCGGKIYRHWMVRRMCGDDGGGDLLCAEVEDRCASCEHVHAMSKRTDSPGLEIGTLFDKWNEDMLSREDFDKGVARILKKAGGSWEKAS